jgi:energy-converting hydrogenase A subunit M
MSIEQKRRVAGFLADLSFAELYAAHERAERAASGFIRVFVEADRNGLTALADLAERCATRCMQQSLALEDEIKARL